jgi:GNAT superfamily N-acetyltransferase
MRLRRARPDDAETIERIRVRGWQVAYRHVFPPAQLDAMAIDWSRWLERLSHPEPGHACYVAEDADGLIGWATIGPSGLPDRFGELHGLYVDPERWGCGAGRALLARGEDELARTWREAILWTLEDNPRTRRFYETAGWRPDGTTGSLEFFGVEAPVVRYAKRLSSSTSRS